MFRKVNIEIWMDGVLMYNSDKKTLLNVMFKIASMLTIYKKVNTIISIK